MTKRRPRLLVLEDGDEYTEFARAFLGDEFEVEVAHDLDEAERALSEGPLSGLLVDLRFDRIDPERLVGDVTALAERHFAGDRERAARYVVDQQGTLLLASLRELGCRARAVFVQDFPARRLANLRALYGDVHALPSFDAGAMRRLFAEAAS